MRFYRNAHIEEIAQEKLADLERKLGQPLTPPIPIEQMAEQVSELHILWDPIQEEPGETILAGLDVDERTIVLNDKHRDLFEENPGIERFSMGHELGHWELFVNKASVGHPLLPSFASREFFLRRSTTKGPVHVIMKALLQTERGREKLRMLHARADHPDEARAVNRFAAAILMPKSLIQAEALKVDRTYWRNLYPVAEKFGVSISALRVRLEQLGLLYVTEGGDLFASPDDAQGQMRLDME